MGSLVQPLVRVFSMSQEQIRDELVEQFAVQKCPESF